MKSVNSVKDFPVNYMRNLMIPIHMELLFTPFTCSHTERQLDLPLVDGRETQAERCRRILSGQLRKHVRRASALTFTEKAARDAAKRANAPCSSDDP